MEIIDKITLIIDKLAASEKPLHQVALKLSVDDAQK